VPVIVVSYGLHNDTEARGLSMAKIMRQWTDEERLEYRKWAHRVAFCYGLAACLLFGAIAMNMATSGTVDRIALASVGG
jgi:hypothetical protein